MDETTIKSKLRLLAIGSPTVLLPVMVGVTGLLTSLALDAATFAFGSGVVTLVGVGVGISRLFAPSKKMVATAINEAQEELIQAKNQRLSELRYKLTGDNDDRTEEYLDKLCELIEQFRQPSKDLKVTHSILIELQHQAEQLFDAGVHQLEVSLTLYTKAKGTNGKLARTFRTERTELIKDIAKTIEALEQALVELHTLDGHSTEMTTDTKTLRENLHTSLKIAEEVELRLRGVDPELDGRRDRYRSQAEQ